MAKNGRFNDQKGADGLYRADRKITKSGTIRFDGNIYTHDKLKELVGSWVHVLFDGGSFDMGPITILPFLDRYNLEAVICVIENPIQYKDQKPVEHYYNNHNEWIELGKSATRAFYANFKSYNYVHNGYGYVNIVGYKYRIKID